MKSRAVDKGRLTKGKKRREAGFDCKHQWAIKEAPLKGRKTRILRDLAQVSRPLPGGFVALLPL
jgi:hypothetical protein